MEGDGFEIATYGIVVVVVEISIPFFHGLEMGIFATVSDWAWILDNMARKDGRSTRRSQPVQINQKIRNGQGFVMEETNKKTGKV